MNLKLIRYLNSLGLKPNKEIKKIECAVSTWGSCLLVVELFNHYIFTIYPSFDSDDCSFYMDYKETGCRSCYWGSHCGIDQQSNKNLPEQLKDKLFGMNAKQALPIVLDYINNLDANNKNKGKNEPK